MSAIELWKSVGGLEGLYEVSSNGRVRSLSHRTGTRSIQGRVLTPCDTRSAGGKITYSRVVLCDGAGGKKARRIQHLVLETFIGPRPMGLVACHKNGNPKDNRLANLRWGTQASNLADALKHGTLRIGLKHQNCKLSDRQVRKIRAMHKRGTPVLELSDHFQVHQMHIYNIVRGKRRAYVHD